MFSLLSYEELRKIGRNLVSAGIKFRRWLKQKRLDMSACDRELTKGHSLRGHVDNIQYKIKNDELKHCLENLCHSLVVFFCYSEL